MKTIKYNYFFLMILIIQACSNSNYEEINFEKFIVQYEINTIMKMKDAHFVVENYELHSLVINGTILQLTEDSIILKNNKKQSVDTKNIGKIFIKIQSVEKPRVTSNENGFDINSPHNISIWLTKQQQQNLSKIHLWHNESGFFTDPRDGKIYKTITIGIQTIMAENLAYKPDFGEYWAYNNKESNTAKYGYLYDWETAKDVAKTIEGWHLPTLEEWETLYNYLGGEDRKVYSAIKENDIPGFNDILGGLRLSEGTFSSISSKTSFWSATAWGENRAWGFQCCPADSSTGRCEAPRSFGFSVRLFRN